MQVEDTSQAVDHAEPSGVAEVQPESEGPPEGEHLAPSKFLYIKRCGYNDMLVCSLPSWLFQVLQKAVKFSVLLHLDSSED